MVSVLLIPASVLRPSIGVASSATIKHTHGDARIATTRAETLVDVLHDVAVIHQEPVVRVDKGRDAKLDLLAAASVAVEDGSLVGVA